MEIKPIFGVDQDFSRYIYIYQMSNDYRYREKVIILK